MISQSAFWDASAVAPLCVSQSTSAALEALTQGVAIVVWWGTIMEVHSAIARLHRTHQLDVLARDQALDLLNDLSLRWKEIRPSQMLRLRAQSLLHRYPLRAADSLQLAAAHIWSQGKPSGKTFICSDLRLCVAAENEGFTVLQP